jgi:hypothetical protein
LVLIALGCVDFGRFAYSFIGLTNCVQAGALYGSMNSYTTSTFAAWQTKVVNTTKNEMNQQSGYDSTQLTVQVTTTVETNGLRRVRVTATYPFQTLLPWPGIPSSVTMSRAVEVRSVR